MPLLEVKIPPMGESISSGILAKWHVNDGDTVKKDQPPFELETDKATQEIPAPASGVLHIAAQEGETVAVGGEVGRIDPQGKPAAKAAPAKDADGAAAKAETKQAPKQQSAAPSPAKKERPEGKPATKDEGEKVLSPAARRIAEEKGVRSAEVGRMASCASCASFFER